MRQFFPRSFLITVFSLLLGAIASFYRDPLFLQVIEGISTLFLRFLKLLSLPLVFFAILSSCAQMTSLKETKILGKKVFQYTFLTTLISSFLALFLFRLFFHAQEKIEGIAKQGIQTSFHDFSFMKDLFPENWIQPFLENQVLSVSFLGFLLGISSIFLSKKQRDVINPLFEAGFSLFLQMASWVVSLLPLGIFCFVVLSMQPKEVSSWKMLKTYVLCVISANLIQAFLVLPFLLKVKRISPFSLFQGAYPALLTAFFTKSSSAALPLTLECAQKRAFISEKIAKFTFPLCSIINMNGCAAFITITTLFVAQSQGIHFSFGGQVIWALIASLAAIGNAGVPMGCYFLAGAFLMGLNIPLDLLGYILPFYAFLDMVETALNVWSDFCVAKLVEKSLENPSLIISPSE